MKVVLVNTPIVEIPHYAFRYNEYLLMPLGILSVATTLKENGHEVKIIDAYVERLSVNTMVKRIFAEDPDMAGIGVLTPSYPMARKLILKIAANKKNNSPLIVVGGPHATLLPERLTQELPIDFLIKGEAEYPFTKLAAAIENSDDFSHIPGIYFRKDGTIQMGPENKCLQDLNALPPLDYSLLNMGLYRAPLQWSQPSRTYNIMTTRGCPFDCPYCANKKLRRDVSSHSIERIHQEIETLISKYDCRRIMIYDSVFPSNRKKGLEFLRMMIESGFNSSVYWFFQTRVELLDEELIALAQKAGCSRISLGVESGDSDILRSINKTFSPDEAIRVSKTIRKYGICVSANFMFGHIGDTSETMKRTSRLSRAMDIDEATFYLLTPYPGTKTFELAKENHEVLSNDWDDYLKSGKFSNQKVAFVPKGLSAKQLLNMRRSAFLRFYLRPKIIWRDFARMGPYYHSLKYLLKISSFFYDILLHLFDKVSMAHEGGVG
jgi:radical SAM superfamily enzyme YgiQ (UPF0313 family)